MILSVQLLEDIAEIDLLIDDGMKILYPDSLLLHGVTMTDGHTVVIK